MLLTRVHPPQLLALALLVLTISLALSDRLTSSSTSVLSRGGKPSGAAAPRTTEANLVTVHAAGRGNPWIKLGDGVEMQIDYEQAALKQLADRQRA